MKNSFRPVGIFVLLFGLVLWGQQRSGAYQDEFGAHPDEAAHFVSALMIRDYIGQLSAPAEERILHPMEFAENFHAHYPKVAIGNWPPGFHTLQAVWMLVFEPGQQSIFLLMAFLTAGLGWLVYWSSRQHLGEGWALAAAILLIVLPIMQKYSSLVMTEVLMGLLVYSGLLLFMRYMETGHWKWSVLFGIVGATAIMVKGTGLVLGLIPPLAILFLKRWNLLAKFSFWLSAVVVGLLCFPWYKFTMKDLKDGWEQSEPSVAFFFSASFYNMNKLVETGGPVFLLCIVIGLATLVRKAQNQETQSEESIFFPMLGILFLAVPLLHCIVPAGKEHRHLIPMLPAFVLFTAFGMKEVVRQIIKEKTSIDPKKATWILTGIGLVGMFASAKEPIYRKGYSGFREVVQELYKVEDWPGPVLISSDASGEGMFVAEAALADSRRPSRQIVRATKVLGTSKWSGAQYETTYENKGELRKLLEDGRYWAIVIDEAVSKQRPDNYSKFAHMKDLEELCHELEFAERFTIRRGGKAYEGDLILYRSPQFPERPQEPQTPDFSELD